MLEINDATPADWGYLRDNLAREDAAEIDAAGITFDAMTSTRANALWQGGALICLFGVEPMPGQPGIGVPWMLCTRHLSEVPRHAMAAISARVVAKWKEGHQELCNLVHRRNRQALRFVRWLGFTVDTRPRGPRQEFFLFSWSRDV
jgi:hypothetical protein